MSDKGNEDVPQDPEPTTSQSHDVPPDEVKSAVESEVSSDQCPPPDEVKPAVEQEAVSSERTSTGKPALTDRLFSSTQSPESEKKVDSLSGSERTGEASGKRHLESQMPFSSLVSGSNSPCEGAVGGSNSPCEGAVGGSNSPCEGAVGGSNSPCEGAVGGSNSPCEGAVGGSNSPCDGAVGGSNPPCQGAFGGRTLERKNSSSDSGTKELNRQASALDRRGLHSGKLDILKKFFNEDGLQFFTVPENRRRHNAERHRHHSEGSRPNVGQRPPFGNPLRHLQFLDAGPQPLLNQAGAIVGVSSQGREGLPSEHSQQLDGFGYVADSEHSLGSAETAPIGEVYAGNFSPARPSSEVSSRGVSSGSSFPSFSSRPPTSSDYDPKISPLPSRESPFGAKHSSPVSTDSDSLPADRPARRRRSGISNPTAMPERSDSALAGSEGSYSDEPKMDSRKKSAYIFDTSSNVQRKISKDSSADSTEQASSISKESSVDIDSYVTQRPTTDSEDEASYCQELSQSAESDDCTPMPDLPQDISWTLQQSLDTLRVSAGMLTAGASAAEDPQQRPESATEESDSEQDPASVLSCSPDASKNTQRHARNKDADK